VLVVLVDRGLGHLMVLLEQPKVTLELLETHQKLLSIQEVLH
jgi:hypothetical protein